MPLIGTTLMRIQTIPHGLSITRLCLKQILWHVFLVKANNVEGYTYIYTVEINRPDSTWTEVNATVYSQSGVPLLSSMKNKNL